MSRGGSAVSFHREPGIALRACSACSGDYEDPERSVFDDPEEKGEHEGNAGDVRENAAREEFPVP